MPTHPSIDHDARERGLEGRYHVQRADQRPIAWAFVLEDRDPLAIPALEAYADAADMAGYRSLASDLRKKLREMRVLHAEGTVAVVDTSCRACGATIATGREFVRSDNGYPFHRPCLRRPHTFIQVDHNGMGGPTFADTQEADDFIAEDAGHCDHGEHGHLDQDARVATLYAKRTMVMTWAEYEALGEWGGY